jgi:transcriptional regulator with XRE-family HTH domain
MKDLNIHLGRISEACLGTAHVTTRQVKAARALLDWSQAELASASGLSAPTIKRIEAKSGDIGGRADTAARIVAALESAGVEFISENGGGVGVRMREGRKPETIALEDLNASNDE